MYFVSQFRGMWVPAQAPWPAVQVSWPLKLGEFSPTRNVLLVPSVQLAMVVTVPLLQSPNMPWNAPLHPKYEVAGALE